MKTKNQIKNASILSYGVILFNIIAGLIYTPWMVSQIGRDDYGLYILVTTFLAYFVVDYGMWQSINKLLSEYRAENDQLKIQRTIGIATRIYLFFDALILVTIATVYFNLDIIFENLSPSDLMKFKKIFIIAGVSSILNFPFGFVRGIMYSFEYLVESNYIELGAKVALIIATVIALSLGGGLYWLVLVYALVPLVKNIISVFFLYSQGVRVKFNFWSNTIAKSIFGISSWLFLYVLGELFINNISPTIISIRSSLEQVSIFAIGLTVSNYVYQISNSVSGLFLPKVSRMNYNGQIKELDDYGIKIARIQLVITGFIVLGIIFCGSKFIYAWMGERFADSYYVATFLVIPGLIIYSQQIAQSNLLASGKIKYQSIMMMLTAFFSVMFSYLLTPKYGAIGTALAISFSNFVFMAIGMNIVYKKVLNNDVGRFCRVIVRFLFVFFVIGTMFFLFEKYLYEPYFYISNKWLDFLFIGIVYAIFYIILVYFLLLDKSEKNIVVNLIFNKNN